MNSNKFDLIISDWNMDGMDGLTLLKTIRSNPLTKRMPFFMATGQRDTEMVKTTIQAGGNNYLVKPFNAATMRQKIEAVIGNLGDCPTTRPASPDHPADSTPEPPEQTN